MFRERLRNSTFFLHARLSLGRPMIKYALCVQPFVYLLLVFAVLHMAGSPRTLSQAGLTAGLVAAWGTVVFTIIGEIGRERSMGTLGIIALTPTGLWGAFVQKAVGSVLLAGFPLLIWIVTVAVFQSLSLVEVALALLATAGFLFAALALGLCLGALLVWFDKSRFIMNYLELPIFLLSGFFVPVSFFGPGLQIVAGVLPTKWPVEALRGVVMQEPASTGPVTAIVVGFAISAAMLCAARLVLQRAEYAARRTGALEEQLA